MFRSEEVRENPHKEARLNNLEINFRALDARVWTLAIIGATLIGGLYVYIGTKTDLVLDRIDTKTTALESRMTTLELTMKDVQSDQKIMRNDIDIIKNDIAIIKEAVLKK